jgi:hypothetical protein
VLVCFIVLVRRVHIQFAEIQASHKFFSVDYWYLVLRTLLPCQAFVMVVLETPSAEREVGIRSKVNSFPLPTRGQSIRLDKKAT